MNMRMRICYLYCHEAGLCCYLVIHIESVLLPFVSYLLTPSYVCFRNSFFAILYALMILEAYLSKMKIQYTVFFLSVLVSWRSDHQMS
jgi:hypothetical protein